MSSAKHHVIGTLAGVTVTTVEQLRPIMYRIATLQKFNVRREAFEQFEPVGATGMLLLAESHFSCHTFPETGEVFVDVFCCSDSFVPEACMSCIETEFSGRGTWQVIKR